MAYTIPWMYGWLLIYTSFHEKVRHQIYQFLSRSSKSRAVFFKPNSTLVQEIDLTHTMEPYYITYIDCTFGNGMGLLYGRKAI